MLGFGATGQFAIGEVGSAAAETITPDKWYMALSEPPRFLPGLKTSAQQFSALSDPVPFVSFGWFEELSKPQRLTRPALNASEVPFVAMQPAPSPFVATGWFEALSEPVRKLPGLPAAAQQFFATDTSAIPISKLIEWFAALSEPPRFRSGLAPRLQQFLAAPTQLRPKPTTTGVLAAIETKDVFLAGAQSWNRINSAEMGIIENKTPQAELGVSKVRGALTAKMSISIL